MWNLDKYPVYLKELKFEIQEFKRIDPEACCLNSLRELEHYAALRRCKSPMSINASYVISNSFCIIRSCVVGSIFRNLLSSIVKQPLISSGCGIGGKEISFGGWHMASAILSIAYIRCRVWLFSFFSLASNNRGIWRFWGFVAIWIVSVVNRAFIVNRVIFNCVAIWNRPVDFWTSDNICIHFQSYKFERSNTQQILFSTSSCTKVHL